MSGAIELQPFARITATVDAPLEIGALSTGGKQIFVNVPTSKLETLPGIEPALSATGVLGGDWMHVDPDGKHLRTDIRATFKTDDGAYISYSASGVITVTEELGLILAGSPDAKTTKFGNIILKPVFQAGEGKYQFLENDVFISNGHFLVGEEGPKVENILYRVIGKE